VRKVVILHRGKEERNILHTVKERKANRTDHILHRNCLLKHIIAVKIEKVIKVTGRQGRRHKQLLDNFNRKRGDRKLREEALYRTVW
jgi:hypothetical protein